MFTTPNCYNSTLGGDNDVYFLKMNGNGTRILYSTYFGTDLGEDYRSSLSKEINNITIYGMTASTNFPVTKGAYATNLTYGGAFLSTFTIETIPGVPENLAAFEGDGNISLSWTPPLDKGNRPITNYSIYRGPDPENLTHYKVSGPETFFKDTDVEFGVEYYYSVGAINEIGEGFQSNCDWNISCTRPGSPYGMKAEVMIGGILIDFNSPEFTGGIDITNYHLYRNGEHIKTLRPDDLDHFDSDIGLGQFYTYNVTSENRKGESDLSKGITVRAKDLPSTPLNFNAKALGRKIILRWEEPDYFGGLEIERYTLYKGLEPTELNPVRSFEPDVLYFEDTHVYIGDEYFYSLSVSNEIGESMRTPLISAIPMEKPSVPMDIIAEPGPGYIDISWSPPQNNGGDPDLSYNLYHGTADIKGGLMVILPTGQTSYRHEGIPADTRVYLME
jgi:hypothetical protein